MNRIQTIIHTFSMMERISENPLAEWFRQSLKPAIQGLKWIFVEERNFRIEIILGMLAVAAGIVLRISNIEWLAISLCIGIVLVTEALNSAIERIGDSINPSYDPLIGRIKDIAAGAVLIASITALACGSIIFISAIMK